MIDEKLYAQTIRSLMLAILSLQEHVAALAAALHDSGHLDQTRWQGKIDQLHVLNRPKRMKIEGIEEIDLAEFLRDFEGPIQ